MSIQLIEQYRKKVEEIIQFGGSKNETAVQDAFRRLIEGYIADKKLEFISGIGFKTRSGTTVYPDATLKDALRQDWGHWESKDQYDSLDKEIQKKIAKGYPTTNIIFEDSQTAVLIQNGSEVSRSDFSDELSFDKLLRKFVDFEPKEVQKFRQAIENFKGDLPDLLVKLRLLIEEQANTNSKFANARKDFLELCQNAINPHLVMADIREMIIQHILTEDIFIAVFNDPQFHRENNIAKSLQEMIETFFKGEVRKSILQKIEPYILIIRAAASNISDHHEKQRFLKVVYENFYRAYNPAAADRLGIIYTPIEIVRFMVEAVDYLLERNFGRLLGDANVEILDPATGTGTFITEIIENLSKNRLPYKYDNEIHCNEVAILPYYIANLNIEYTYAQKMGAYKEFKNICFADTLDNLAFAFKSKESAQSGFDFMSLNAENLDRIKRQNKKKISVIIGNPPYNANQLNENENNKNRPYPNVDKRIKDTYVFESSAQKTKLYDMYSRFIRWSSDRLDKNGILALITNRSFIDARTYDGFRKVVAGEFSEIYVVDLGGDVRKNPKLSGPKNNVFGIQTGVAISFFVKNENKDDEPCRIYYSRRPEMDTARDKLQFLSNTKFKTISFEHIKPDKKYNWINIATNDWADDLIPLASREVKLAKNKINYEAIFKLYSLGVVTSRDEWVYDFSLSHLRKKVKYFCDFYNKEIIRWNGSDKKTKINDFVDRTIKWTSELEAHLIKNSNLIFNDTRFKDSIYRPFVKSNLYFDKIIIHRLYQQDKIFRIAEKDNNIAICISGTSSSKPFQCLAVKHIPSYDILEKTQCFPLYLYNDDGARVENINDWALNQFRKHYGIKSITSKDIFHYVYAVLHHPTYREKYKINLNQDFPQIPLYSKFQKWVSWGAELMDLHINYEKVIPYKLKIIDKMVDKKDRTNGHKTKLKADKKNGIIILDSITSLKGIPQVAWKYKLGNRSAIEWVLEYYKERKPKDPTIRNRFDNYKFADYKDDVIDLLRKVCEVSVQTMEIVSKMQKD